ncbi:TniB family NTP-binding protein [Lysobacter sp. K5869]|uniref:TniB family NTP-binding protein n=1 Tax=Lysobacter sp. K5869 TaxID=2820808 RepID=UPI001C060898|nr:TniB family NTP-binding protein [Lysobacter sp. K5869]QWP77216.1 TniB family NTP-binding protein [Lysobacter sp. K5869]
MNNFDETTFCDDDSQPNGNRNPSISVSGRLEQATQALLEAPLEARIQHVLQDRLVRYPAFDSVKGQAEWLIYEPRQTRARGIVVSSERGNGKTTLAHIINRQYNDRSNLDRPFVVEISMSGARDARTVYGRILESLGSPARISHRVSDRETLVSRLLRSVGCRLLVLDEVQDIMLGNEREQQRALEGIKFLMNELQMHVLGFGTDKAFQGLASDPHLEARFTEYVLPRWKADSTLANFLATYERCLPFSEPSHLGREEVVKHMAKVGGGTLGRIVTRLQNAALEALCEGERFITMSRLETAVMRPARCAIRPQGKP